MSMILWLYVYALYLHVHRNYDKFSIKFMPMQTPRKTRGNNQSDGEHFSFHADATVFKMDDGELLKKLCGLKCMFY